MPRTWSLVWLAGAHRDVPAAIPTDWRGRWTAEAERYHQVPLPERFEDEPNAGRPVDADQRAAEARSTAGRACPYARPAGACPRRDRPRLVRSAWVAAPEAEVTPTAAPTIVASLDAAALERLPLAPRTLPLADVAAAKALLAAAIADGARVAAAVAGDVVVGVALVAPAPDRDADEVLAVGVAPDFRRRGLATAPLRSIVDERTSEHPLRALVTVGERDPIEPLDRPLRATIARRLLESAGFRVSSPSGRLARADPMAIEAVKVDRH